MAKNAVNYTGIIPETGDSFESATQNTTGSFDGIDNKLGVLNVNKLEKGSYTGNAQQLKTEIDDKLPKGGYTGTAKQLKNELDSLGATGSITPQAITETGEASKLVRVNSAGQIVGTFISNEQIMGVRFVDNGTDFVATRYGIIAGAVQESTTVENVTTVKCKVGTTFLDDMMIYRLMRRGIFDNNANLVFDQDAVGYDDTLSTGGLAPHTHWVGVYIPKFWYRYNVSYDATIPLTVVQHVVDAAISDKPFTGAKVHEWFTDVDTDGNVVERSYRVASAFEGVAVNGSTGAYLFADRTDITTRIASDFQLGTPSGLTAYSTYKLTSVNKANAQAPTTSSTLSNFRTMCQNRHVGNTRKRAITQQPWYANHAINILFIVYYASMNWQGVLSNGVSNLNVGNFNESVSTGYTSSMKNNSGFVSGIVRGTLGTTQVTNFKGIENFFGNVWKFNEGLKKLSTGLGNQVKIGTYNVTKVNDYANYVNVDFTNEKEILNVPIASDFFKFRGENMIANSAQGSSNYYRDYLYSSVNGQIALSGASWWHSSSSGGFAVNLNIVFGSVDRLVGSRVFS